MFYRQISVLAWPAVFLFSLFYLGCGFADLRPINVRTIPEGPWALLPGEDSPVFVFFDTDMDRQSVERVFQIYSPFGITEGESRWEGRNLFFLPAAPWRPGIRYSLRLSGTVISLDGRELLLARDFPFYAVSHSLLPYVVSFSPGDGVSVGVSETIILELNFSQPMDLRCVEDAFKLDIPGEKLMEWLNDDRTLRVYSDAPLNPWIVYKWSISEKALSREGAPLAKETSGRFITDLDREFISVVQVLPLMPPLQVLTPGFEAGSAQGPWGSWLPIASNMEQGPGSGHGIGVRFSKSADDDSLRRAFSFVPSLPGRVEILSSVSAVYIPSKDPEPETVYSMRISGGLKDLEGLKMGEDYTTTFVSDIPFLSVYSISSVEGEGKFLPESGDLLQVPVDAFGRLGLFIRFTPEFDAENSSLCEESAFKISLRPFFPGTLPAISLRTAKWQNPDRLFLQWEGLDGGEPGALHYYRLIIPGGTEGIQNGWGSYLKEDFVLYLEVKHE